MTDDKEDKTLEHQEHFTEVAKSRDVEVISPSQVLWCNELNTYQICDVIQYYLGIEFLSLKSKHCFACLEVDKFHTSDTH